MKPAYLIAAPAYNHQSGGIRALHELCDTLNRLGYEAGIIFFHNGNAVEQNFQWFIANLDTLYMPNMLRKNWSLDDPFEEVKKCLSYSIMIYPDLICGNPLGASKVVRYLLNKNTSDLGDDYILSFSKMYRINYHLTLFNVFSDVFVHSMNSQHWSKRMIDLTYFGKGANFIECHKIPETIVLERNWPSDKDQLGILLRNSRFMFSWDSVTATNTDAVICGCIPVLLHDKQISRAEISQSELGSYPTITLENLNDKNSTIFDLHLIDMEIERLKERYNHYINSWDSRVQQFVEHCNSYFNLDWN